MCDLVVRVFNNPEEVSFINHTFISLTLKIENPKLVNHFRPIGLCNVSYKIITKILTNRLKRIMPLAVAPTQCGFIPGRQGANNIIVAQEIIHKMWHVSGNKGYMTIKLDLKKAYDRLS